MIDFSRLFKYSAIALVLILFVILGGWYIYLRNQTSSIEQVASGRGLNEAPAEASSLGSMFSNIVAGFAKSDDAARAGQGETGGTVSGGGGGSFKAALGSFKNIGTGISNFSDSVKDAFGSLVSETPSSDQKDFGDTPKTPRLWHAHKTPIAGFGFLGTTTTIRFMERSSGHLFDINPHTGDIKRITNTLIAKPYEAELGKDGSVIITTLDEDGARYTTSATVTASTTEGLASLATVSLGTGTLDVAPSPTTHNLLALVDDAGGSAIVRSSWDGSSPTRIFSSGLKGWKLFWTQNATLISQKAASGVPGYAYKIENGSLVPIARGVAGLTILPHPSSNLYLIGSDNLSVTLRMQSATSTTPLPIRTVADKCTWTRGEVAYCAVPERIASSRFLDDWYRGIYHTSDSWWRVGAGTTTTELLMSPQSEYSVSLDVKNPMIDDEGKYLAFINASDQSLWVLRISNQ